MAKVNGQMIKKIMKDLKLTDRDIEEKAKVSDAVLQNLKAGKMTSPEDLRKVAAVLKVQPDKLTLK